MENALKAMASMLERSEIAQLKFAQGTPQHTLQKNRMKALRIAAALIEKELAGSSAYEFTNEEISAATAPLTSLLSKSEKAIQKLAHGTWQHTMLESNLRALHIALPLLGGGQGAPPVGTDTKGTADWLDEVRGRVRRKNQILFAKNSAYLSDLAKLIRTQNHRAAVLWALELADGAAGQLSGRYPAEQRPALAVAAARDWAAGRIKMRPAQRAILGAHAFAKELSSPEDIALCHAVGQACGVVHAMGHAIGFPIYELTAVVRRYGTEHCRGPVERRKQEYIERLNYWSENYERHPCDWADFMTAE